MQKFTPDAAAIAMWGKAGSAPGEFSSPYGIAVDANGVVYVTDQFN